MVAVSDSDSEPSEVDRVIAALRDGQTAQVGGGRCFSTYLIRDGQPIVAKSDEGHVDEVLVTEPRLRELIAAERALFLDYLRIWKR
jgi:hypothetical protein